MTKSILNIGVLAHVDAGKTTVTEQMLFAAGALRQAGSVDQGTSATDHLAVERERGISVRLATASFTWKGQQVNIIDTPGHVDFSSEVERSLLTLDAAVLVLSAVEGVQAQTLTVFHALRDMQIPTLVFINKVDRMGADVAAVIEELEKEFAVRCFVLQSADNAGEAHVSLHRAWSEHAVSEQQIEQVVELDEGLLERFLEGEAIGFKALDAALKSATVSGDLVPVLCGVGKLGLGIEALMDAIVRYLPAEAEHENADSSSELSAVVFKIEHDKTLGRMAYIRVFSGQILPREVVITERHGVKIEQKISQIKQVHQGKYVAVDVVPSGDIGVVSGLADAQVGDVFGDAALVPRVARFSAPLLTVQVKADKAAEFPQLAQALQQLSAEDPMLDLEWLADIRELHIKIAGKIQIEILAAQLLDRYGLNATFEEPTIIYQETPIKTALGYERYWMPKPCWAIMEVKLKPGELGSGVTFESKVSHNDVAAKYQKEIEATLPQALKQGTKGWQVTDVEITLVAGEDHNVHSRSGDFAIATPMAIMNGLVLSGTQLLEPILAVKITAPLDLLGTISSDITKMRGVSESPDIVGERFTLNAQIPAATSIDYPVQLASKSGGKAKFSSRLLNYQPCELAQGQTREYRGVSSLDRDKWILQARGAL
ncbi:TetM/TetW/TetO/TetS family tetracycline resistance ribosomal protection protein [Marinicella sp. S1101]|uniref:GTP-binding protein n=1 Tax=Marinicella marina TaxID=2996016 RepID=UPI002260BBFF|nr:TetM/TetW/TetO/TetS family tetracycline resistance ribosomal protection protein [Marinicella marina]MCX7553285.1 TetM/TetW/TetO/TetS family tetracycline resistance ribosomal protection protein [Marinicella marina]MDJ1139017.1 TetM/TetW/TetO/TetS family tetracycline resistance ribosomal protection protein [Marinicella marina]